MEGFPRSKSKPRGKCWKIRLSSVVSYRYREGKEGEKYPEIPEEEGIQGSVGEGTPNQTPIGHAPVHGGSVNEKLESSGNSAVSSVVDHGAVNHEPVVVDSVEQASKVAFLQQKGYSVNVSRNGKLALISDMGVDHAREKKRLRVLPGYNCSACHIGPECPEFQEGSVCAFRESFKAFPARDAESVMHLMGEIVDSNKERWRFGLMTERLVNGGMPDPNVTRLSEVVMSQTQDLIALQKDSEKVSITFTEQGTTATEAVEKGGFLSKLFQGIQPEPPQIVDHAKPPELVDHEQPVNALPAVERVEPVLVEENGEEVLVGRGENPMEGMSL